MTNRRRNVLVVAPFLPYPPDFGGALRVYHLVRGLQQEHDVHLVAPVVPDEADSIRMLGDLCDVTAVPAARSARQKALVGKRAGQLAAMASAHSYLERSLDIPRLQAVMDRIFLTRKIDLVQYEFAQSALVRPSRPVPTIVDAHNIEHQLLQRIARTSSGALQEAFNLLEWRKVRRLEEQVWRSATLVVATSEQDARTISSTRGTPVTVVPNGVDMHAFNDPASRRVPHQVVFTGAMRHHPNADGARWYAEQIHPLVLQAVPDARLLIVGADPPADIQALASNTIVVTGTVDRIEPYLTQSAVAVVPLRSGGGTRLKILEAFAARTPVVSTTIGAEGLDAVDSVHLLIRDRPDDFAQAVIELLCNNPPDGFSTEHGYELAALRYDWDAAVIPKLLAAHERAVATFSDASE